MVRILLLLLGTYQSCSSTTMVTISDIQRRHLGKLICDSLHILIIIDYPELMAETIDWGNEIIFWLCSCITHNKLVQHSVVRISKEYWLDVSIVYTNMLHAVLFLITTSKLMLLDIALHVVIYISTNYQSVLSLAVHGLSIDVVMFSSILHQPPLILELLEVLGSLLIHTRIIL